MALTDLTNLKLFIGITSSDYDTLLTEIINAVSAAIETYCDRTFAQANYTDFRLYETDMKQNFKLREHPVTLVYSAAYGNTECLELDFNSKDTTFYQVWLDDTRLTVSQADGTTTNSYTLDDYADIEALFDAIIVDYAAFTVTWRDNWYKQLPPEVLIPDALNTIVNTLPDARSFYIVDEPVQLFKVGKRLFRIQSDLPEGIPIMVRYQAGYSTIPLDLEMICKKICQGVWEGSGQGNTVTNTNLKREKIGKYEYENQVGTAASAAKGSKDIKGLVSGLVTADVLYDLDKYRNKDLA